MFLDFTTLPPLTAYRWISSTVIPRPVAWVSTCSAAGVSNLAPFSYFQAVTAAPPTLMLSIGLKPDGLQKDTTRNIERTLEFVVNLVSFEQAAAMNATSYAFEHGISEFEHCGIPSLPSTRVAPARVQGAPVAFECRLAAVHPYPVAQPTCHVILGEIVAAHIDERILNAEGRVDPMRLDLVGRMGGDWYTRTADEGNFEMKRPTTP
ncbi:MAG: flavin reductase family protein [Azospirillaceae bacterium]|nr:flavin reductase family protein [Azospirillaceae bacterium]